MWFDENQSLDHGTAHHGVLYRSGHGRFIGHHPYLCASVDLSTKKPTNELLIDARRVAYAANLAAITRDNKTFGPLTLVMYIKPFLRLV